MRQMFKTVKNSLIIITIFSVLVAGSFWVYTEYFAEISQPEKVVKPLPDPEEEADPDIMNEVSFVADEHLNEDGTYTVKYSAAAEKYRVEPGVFAPIDTKIVKSKAEDFDYENTTNIAKTYFKVSTEDSGNLITFNMPGDKGVESGFVEAVASIPQVEGNVITYPDLYNGLDVRYAATNNGLVEEIIVDYKEQAVVLDRITETLNLKGVYYIMQEDGSISFHDKETRNLTFIIPAPIMYEVNNPNNHSFGLHFEIDEADDDKAVISKVIDQAGKDWLAGAEYPVAIDWSYSGVWQANSGSVSQRWDCGTTATDYAYVFSNSTAFVGKRTCSSNSGGGCLNQCHMYFYRNYMSFLTGDNAQPGGANFPDSLITDAKLTFYMYRNGDQSYSMYAYQGPDEWGTVSFSPDWSPNGLGSAAWNMFFNHPSASMINLGWVSPTGLPNSVSTCWSDPASCQRVINLNTSYLSTILANGETHIMLRLPSDEIPVSSFGWSGGYTLDRYWGVYVFQGDYSVSALRPVLEITYGEPPGPAAPIIRVDPLGTSTNSFEIQIDDDDQYEVGWVLERSFDQTTWSEVCNETELTTGSGFGTCSNGISVNMGCSTTKGGTTGVCTVTDSINTLVPQYANRQVYYRAKVVRQPLNDEYPGVYPGSTSPVESAWSSQSPDCGTQTNPFVFCPTDAGDGVLDSHDYTFAVAPADHPTWSSNNYNEFDYVPNYNEPAENYEAFYCFAFFSPSFSGSGNWYNVSVSTPGPYPSMEWVQRADTPPSGLDTAGREYLAKNRCFPMSTWNMLINAFSMPVKVKGEYPSYLRLVPSKWYVMGTYVQHTRDGTVSGVSLVYPDPVVAYTRPRTPSAPIDQNASTDTSIKLLMNSAPWDPGTPVNPSEANYSMQVYEDLTWKKLDARGGSIRDGLWSWQNYDVWDGDDGTGQVFTGFDPYTCYQFRATARIAGPDYPGGPVDWYYGERDDKQYSPQIQACTTLAIPPAPTVNCYYTENMSWNSAIPPGGGTDTGAYQCQVTVNSGTNPTSGVYYKIDRRVNTGAWVTVRSWSTNKSYLDSSANSCGGNYEYRITAAEDVNGLNATAVSPIGSNPFPPCPPSDNASMATAYNVIDWKWIAGLGTAPTSYQLQRMSLLPIYSGVGTSFIESGPGLNPNTQWCANVRGFGEGAWGQWSPKICLTTPAADASAFTVNCGYDEIFDDYYCDADITDSLNPAGTEYTIERNTGVAWTTVIDWTPRGASDTWSHHFEDDTDTFVQCNSLNTNQEYRVKFRVGPPYQKTDGVTDSDTLPPCAPTFNSPDHDSQTTSRLRWKWVAPSGGAPANQYFIEDISACNNIATFTVNTYYIHYGPTNTGCRVRIKALDSALRSGRHVYSNYRYTSIETVSSVIFNTWDVGSLSFYATPSLSNLGSASSGVQFRRTNSTVVCNWKQANTCNDSNSLMPNTQYCYQAQTRNGDGDTTSYRPASPGSCTYTHAAVPDRPAVTRLGTGESVQLTLRTASDNNPGYTNYAICVTKHNSDGSTTSKYTEADADEDGIVYVQWGCDQIQYNNETDCTDNGGSWNPSLYEDCSGSDDTGNWAQRMPVAGADWGGTSGITIAGLEPSTKYDFKAKAKNNNTGGAGNGQNWTTFGAQATLFLVKNNLVGWAWTSHLGWISLNCLNQFNATGFGYSCGSADDWGLNTDFAGAREINPLVGYAWSSSGRALTSAGGAVKAGLGWLSAFSKVCSHNSQIGCMVDADCGVGNTCDQSAGTPPDNVLYGYCYNGEATDEKYGLCSDNGLDCTESNTTACVDPDAKCIFETCKTGDICPDVGAGTEYCKEFATANFSGTTREIEGYLRIKTFQDEGVTHDCDPNTDGLQACEWGWLKLGGEYVDEDGNTGNYSLSGTEVDSQEYLGDPDVNPDNVELYSMFGWGWQAEDSDLSDDRSRWLNRTNVSRSGMAAANFNWDPGKPSLAIDSEGDPHMAWSQFNPSTNAYDIYYIKLKAGIWYLANGFEYQPGISPSITKTGVDSIWPSLDLDSNDVPHLAWVEDSVNGEVYYSKWDSNINDWSARSYIDVGKTVSLDLDRSDQPHVVYQNGSLSASEIYYRWWNGASWVTAFGDSNTQLDISNTPDNNPLGASSNPKLVLSFDDPQRPYVVWQETAGQCTGGTSTICITDADCDSGFTCDASSPDKHIMFRMYASGDWVTMSGDPLAGVKGYLVSANADIGTAIPGMSINGADPDVYHRLYPGQTFYTPAVAWRDPAAIIYRWADSVTGAWVSASNLADGTNLQINLEDGAEPSHPANTGKSPSVTIDSEGQPHVVWGDDVQGDPEIGDIRYRYFDTGSNAWVTSSGDFTPSGTENYNDANLTVSATPGEYSRNSTVRLDKNGNPHIIWTDTKYDPVAVAGDLRCDPVNNNADCTDIDYPHCVYHHTAGVDIHYCAASDLMYNRWSSGKLRTGLGWVEFMPFGALMGIPWIQTLYSDIYAQDTITVEPPPRGTGDYTSTYLILANGEIQGLTTRQPTSAYSEPGFEPVISGICTNPLYITQETCETAGFTWTGTAGYPAGKGAVAKLNVDRLITDVGSGKNKYGHTIVTLGSSDLSTGLGASPILNGQVYYYNGNATIDSEITFTKGSFAAETRGNGLIVIGGDLEVNANTYYDSTTPLADVSEMPSVAFIVRGNIYISPFADEQAGVFVAVDNPTTTDIQEGSINTSRKTPLSYSIAASADDTEVESGAYANDSSSGAIRFGNIGGINYRANLRWPINIPAGSEIRHAYLKLTGDGNGAGDFKSKIYLLDSSDAGLIDFVSSPNEPLYNYQTSNSVSFDIKATSWDVNSINESSEIKSLVQKFINNDSYQPGNYIGLVIQEGDATAGEYRSFISSNGGTSPGLVIEYSPRRVSFKTALPTDSDSAYAWSAGFSSAATCERFGWASSRAERTYLRFADFNIPKMAEVQGAHLRNANPACGTTGAAGFQARQGLLDGYPGTFSANPYNLSLDINISEIAEDINNNETPAVFSDISILVDSFISRTDYDPNTADKHELSLRLRRGNDVNEAVAGSDEYRRVDSGSLLEVDYLMPLQVNGLFVAQSYNFDRKYTKDLAPSEQIVYDGRVVANTPPGLADFIKAIPEFQKVIP